MLKAAVFGVTGAPGAAANVVEAGVGRGLVRRRLAVGPFGEIAGHVMDAVSIGQKAAHRGGARERVAAREHGRALPGGWADHLGAGEIGRRLRIALRQRGQHLLAGISLVSAPGGLAPLVAGRQAVNVFVGDAAFQPLLPRQPGAEHARVEQENAAHGMIGGLLEAGTGIAPGVLLFDRFFAVG